MFKEQKPENAEQFATAAMEETNKRRRSCKIWKEEVEEDLNIRRI